MTEQYDNIHAMLCPCEYCRKKDRIVIEEYGYNAYPEPLTVYRIRCTRLLCRIRNLFYPLCDKTLYIDKAVERWNMRFTKGYKGYGRWIRKV